MTLGYRKNVCVLTKGKYRATVHGGYDKTNEFTIAASLRDIEG